MSFEHPTLEYSPPPRPSWLRRHRRWIAIAVIVLTAILLARVGWQKYRVWQAARYANAFRVIDADVPGTEVYFGGKRLGRTPLLLSQADCTRYGLPTAALSHSSSVEFDGWGEGILMGSNRGGPQVRLTLKAPASVASKYLSFQTPDGTRTKIGGGRDLPNGVRAHLFAIADERGMRVTFQLPDSVRITDAPIPVTVTVSNKASVPFAGKCPQIEFIWSNADTAWPKYQHKAFDLPAQWEQISAGQSLHTQVQLPPPPTAGNYSVFVIFSLFESKDRNYLVAPGSIYSDSHLQRVVP